MAPRSSEASEPTLGKVVDKAPVVRQSASKPAKPAARKWEEVSGQIKKLREAGETVPAIAEKLQVSRVIVNQFCVRSYKMTVSTKRLFEREEERRLAEG